MGRCSEYRPDPVQFQAKPARESCITLYCLSARRRGHLGIAVARCAQGSLDQAQQGLILIEYIQPLLRRTAGAGNAAGQFGRAGVDQGGGKVYLLLDNANFVQPMDFARMTGAGTGDSWEEVEAELEMPKGTLSATMAFYNEHARAGRDPLFGKRAPILQPLDSGPFIALELNFESSYFSFFTLGGLRTSTKAEVLDRARRDAARVPVGRRVGKPGIGQDNINRKLVEAALAGQRAVRGLDDLLLGGRYLAAVLHRLPVPEHREDPGLVRPGAADRQLPDECGRGDPRRVQLCRAGLGADVGRNGHQRQRLPPTL